MSDMSADERFVRDHWEHIGSWVRDLDSYGRDQFNVGLFASEKDAEWHIGHFQRWQEDNDAKGIAKVWSDAAEFTRERLEEIRQIEEEILRCEEACAMYYEVVLDQICEVDGVDFDDCEWDALYDLCANSRILAREQSALAELKKGMKGRT